MGGILLARPLDLTWGSGLGQVCLAAEECGHLGFDTRCDTWWNGDAFHCGGAPASTVHFYDIILKAQPLGSLLCCLMFIARPCRLAPQSP